uniref:Uncharacterized protein n=1 Tax=Cucumis melo TaxID=3656 RepID=A0A9I9E487_CUCME
FCRYLSTWFIFDVCSTAPLQSISFLFTNQTGEVGFKLLNMLWLWRLRRVSSLFARFGGIYIGWEKKQLFWLQFAKQNLKKKKKKKKFAKMDGSRSLKFTFCSRFSTL